MNATTESGDAATVYVDAGNPESADVAKTVAIPVEDGRLVALIEHWKTLPGTVQEAILNLAEGALRENRTPSVGE